MALLALVFLARTEAFVSPHSSSRRTQQSATATSLPAEEEVLDLEQLYSSPNKKEALLVAIAGTARGQSVKTDKAKILSLVEALESEETYTLEDMEGRWSLAYSDGQLFRSSPFWMAGRATCRTQEEAKRYDLFCDLHRAATAVGSIGAVRQIIDSKTRKFVSEFETTVAASPQRVGGALPVTISGAIVSSADIVDHDGRITTLYVDDVAIKGSNIPLLRPMLDSMLKLDSRAVANALSPLLTAPRPSIKTTYVDDNIRIVRENIDDDPTLFVYVRDSPGTHLTAYDDTPADLGLSGLLTRAASTFPFF